MDPHPLVPGDSSEELLGTPSPAPDGPGANRLTPRPGPPSWRGADAPAEDLQRWIRADDTLPSRPLSFLNVTLRNESSNEDWKVPTTLGCRMSCLT
jgi:hypothetical protein